MSQKNKLLYYWFIGLLLFNVALALLLLHGRDFNIKTESYEILSAKKAAGYYASINRSDIAHFLDVIGFDNFDDSSVLFLVPPYPCDVCLDEQISLFQKRVDYERMILVVPSYRKRDMRVQFPECEDRIIGYDINGIQVESPLKEYDGVIICTFKDGGIDDSFLTNKMFPDLSDIFYDKLL